MLVLRKIYIRRPSCYGSRLKGLSQEATLVLSNTRELDRVLSTEWSTLYTILSWSVLTTVHPTLNDHE